jgi:hypothetical protein
MTNSWPSEHVLPRQSPARVIGPTDHGLISWNFQPELSGLVAAFAPTLGTVYLMKLPVPAGLITNVIIGVSVSGVGLTSGQNFAGLYSSGKVLLSATADQTTPWGTTTGPQIMALTTAQTVPAGYVYVGVVSNAATSAPTLNRAGGVSAINVGLTNATAMYATGGTTQTALPGTVTTTSFTTASIWAAVS